MENSEDFFTPEELKSAVARARGSGAALSLAVVFTPEHEDWGEVLAWHEQTVKQIHKKLGDTGQVVNLCIGRMAVMSDQLEPRQLEHNIRSALGFADLPTRIGSYALEDAADARDLLLRALNRAKK